jgi:RES domain-containing protein
MRVWRICKAQYAHIAFSGEGARLYPGRWNPAGVPMVYTSTSLALACLELFVHLDPSMAPDDLVSVSAEIPESETRVEQVSVADLPKDWRKISHRKLQEIGRAWVQSGRSAALQVPSAVVDEEWNVLLNPAHPDFTKVQIGEPKPFHFDERMFR